MSRSSLYPSCPRTPGPPVQRLLALAPSKFRNTLWKISESPLVRWKRASSAKSSRLIRPPISFSRPLLRRPPPLNPLPLGPVPRRCPPPRQCQPIFPRRRRVPPCLTFRMWLPASGTSPPTTPQSPSCTYPRTQATGTACMRSRRNRTTSASSTLS